MESDSGSMEGEDIEERSSSWCRQVAIWSPYVPVLRYLNTNTQVRLVDIDIFLLYP